MEVSVVTTLYKSAAHIEEFTRRIVACLRAAAVSYEIIFVNDGCPAGSLQIAKAMVDRDPHIKVVDLSRNFGHHRALMIGLEHSSGNWVYLTDVDLEEPPEIFSDCWMAKSRHPQADVFYGLDSTKKGSRIGRAFSKAFYRTFNLLSGLRIPENLLHSRLMSRRYVDSLSQFRERNLFIPALFELAGFEQISVKAKKLRLPHASSYTLDRRVMMAVEAITSFSERPLIYIFLFGAGQTVISFVSIALVVFLELTGYFGVPGWASIVAILSFLSGATLFSIGLVGLYVARVFVEVKQRPYSLVRQVYSRSENGL